MSLESILTGEKYLKELYYSVIIFYAIAMIAIGFVINRKGFGSIREWALEKNQFGWFVLTMTSFATIYSSFTFVGLPGYFYEHGIGTFLFVTAAASFIAPVFLYIVGKRVLALNADHTVVTPIELLKRRLTTDNYRLFVLVAFVPLIIFNFPYIVIQIVGISKVLNALTDGQVSYQAAAIMVLVTMFIYASLGGLKGVIWTDVIQGAIGVLLMLILATIFVNQEWGSLDGLWHNLKAERPDLMSLPGPTGKYTVSFIIFSFVMFTVLYISYIQMFSRLLLFRTKSVLVKTAFGSFITSLVIGLLVMVLGLGASLAYPGLASGDLAVVEIIHNSVLIKSLANLVGAVFFIAILAGAMSTADSVLFALGTIFSRDFVKDVIKKDLSEPDQKLYIKIFILIFLIISFILAQNPPQLIIDLAVKGIAGITMLVPAFIYLLWRRASAEKIAIAIVMAYSLFGVSFIYPQYAIHAFFAGLIASALYLIFYPDKWTQSEIAA